MNGRVEELIHLPCLCVIKHTMGAVLLYCTKRGGEYAAMLEGSAGVFASQ